MTTPAVTLTVVQSMAGDRNPRGVAGAADLGREIAVRLGVERVVVGAPRVPLGGDWRAELHAADADLRALADHLDRVLGAGQVPVTTMSRCAMAIATFPVVARHRPDAVMVWFDAHADLHVPATTGTGYLGGMAFSASLGLWDSGFGAGVTRDRAVLVGARDIDPAEAEVIDRGAVQHVAGDGLVERLAEVVAGRPVYVHVDCDVLDPGQVSTEYLVPNGLSLATLRAAAEVLARSEVVGLEVGEYEVVPEALTQPPTALADALDPLLDAALR